MCVLSTHVIAYEEFVPEPIQVGDVLYLDKNKNNFTFPQAQTQTCEYTKTAKVCHMGLSNMKKMNTMHSSILQKNEMQPGTPAYQTPEVRVVSAKPLADIWSLYIR